MSLAASRRALRAGGTAEAVGDLMRREHAMWGEVVRANNIRAA